MTLLIVLSLLLTNPAYEEMTVTASMVPEEFSDLARSLTVLDAETISRSGASSIQDLLVLAGVQLRERGAGGVQADVAIRGATFEQTLILLDGVKLSDPQTGHHLLNLPVTVEQIQRIEVLRGPGSRLYGPNAFGGVINIITKEVQDIWKVSIGSGQNGFKNGSLNAGVTNNAWHFNASLDSQQSDGFMENTDYDLQTMNFNAGYRKGLHDYQLSWGQSEKDFGANRFYHPDFPMQREITKATTAVLKGKWILDRGHVSANLYSRKHEDDFVLDYTRPDWYRNVHETSVSGLDLKGSLQNSLGSFSMGMEYIQEEIESSNLGFHDRNKKGVFIEQSLSSERFDWVLGGSAYYFSKHGWEFWPGLDVAWKLPNQQRLFGSVARSFRLPTFTELYYVGGGNRGNDNLNAEQAWNYELGYRIKLPSSLLQLSVFSRDAEDLIDWVWNDEDRFYDAMNFSQVDTRGIELEASWSLPQSVLGITQMRGFYSYIDSELDTSGLQTKYLLNHPRQIATLTVFFEFGQRLESFLSLSHEEYSQASDQFTVDMSTSYTWNKLSVKVHVDNLFNEHHEDFTRLPLPGRWVKCAIGYAFSAQKHNK
ncbi:MAG: hypothetical protein CR997_06480 [Acidobacteria bacterium]|nr:MAG: hypothetical protein CR997_06480 [Acidobacteriota bacterium]